MRLFSGRNPHHFHKAERADSVELSKQRIAKKRLQTQLDAAIGDVASSPPDTDGPFTANDQLSKVPPYTAAPPSPDNLVVGDSEDEPFPSSFAASTAPPKTPEGDTAVDVQDVNIERRDSVELARQRLCDSPRSLRRNARSAQERVAGECEEGVKGASLRETSSSAVTSPSVLPTSSSPRPRPHSAMPSTHRSSSSDGSAPPAMNRSQSSGAYRGQSPRGDPRRRRASTGQHHGSSSVLPEGGRSSHSAGSGSRTMSRKSSDKGPLFDSPGLLRFLKHAFLPSSSSSSSAAHHSSHPVLPASHEPAAESASHNAVASSRSSGLLPEHSSEKAAGAARAGSPPKDSAYGRRSSTPLAAVGSDNVAEAADQGPVAAFFSKIGRVTFNRR